MDSKVLHNMLIPLARDFALRAHKEFVITTVGGLKRPQILHLQEVADLVWASGGSPEEIAAAWLHDVIEDTSATLDEIEGRFGETVAEIVDGLTDPECWKVLPLSERKPKQTERLRHENVSVRRVKIADQTSNIRSLSLDPTTAMTALECMAYVEGAKLLADACKGISPLLDALFFETYHAAAKRYKSLH